MKNNYLREQEINMRIRNDGAIADHRYRFIPPAPLVRTCISLWQNVTW